MRVLQSESFDTAVIGRLRELADRARDSDGAAPFSEDLWQQATSGETSVTLTLPADGVSAAAQAPGTTLAGVAFAARQGQRQAAELLVDPELRGRGYGGALLKQLLDAVDGELWLWSHGDHPAARVLARRHGLVRARELLELRRPAHDPVPQTTAPQGVTVRTFVPGQDEDAWVAVNSAAFSWHPEQGGRTRDDILAAEREAWFDPEGFFLAVDPSGAVIGFHWTKVHPPARGDTGSAALGEVYVLGVDPAAHGSGIGRHLTAVGLRHLAQRPDIQDVQLYVEGDNTAALRVYRRFGFTRHAIDVAYRR